MVTLEFNNLKVRTVQLNRKEERCEVEGFLAEHSLRLDSDVEFTIAVFDDGRIIATGSFAGNVLKCIAVATEYEGMGVAEKIVSRLIMEEYNRGRNHLFIYTKPKNAKKFQVLGFFIITQIDSKVILMENRKDGIEGYIKKLRKRRTPGEIIGSIVVNCNPFTRGHLYLIEKAALECDMLHIFLVWEDRSVFPAEIRYHFVKEGTKHIENVMVHRGENYIISNATFPTYFLKCSGEAVKLQCLLDVKIYAEYIAPTLGINRRYIGEEPNCQVTRTYNQTMKRILPKYGIKVIEVPRKCLAGIPISASAVREHLRQKNIDIVKAMVPKTTFDFLMSKEVISIIDKT